VDKLAKSIIAIPFLLVLGVPVSLLGGVILQDLWGWFIVPLGAAPISLINAVGISLVASFFKMGLSTIKVDDDGDAPLAAGIAKLVGMSLMLLILWGVAAIWQLFMPA
jgi:hypothetical protein